jgi:single-strand DNA-binding protein
VYIEGRLRARDFEDRDGIRRYTTEIVAETVKLLQVRKHPDAAAATVAVGEGA